MKSLILILFFLLVSCFGILSTTWAETLPPRPHQYVALAFDGSLSIGMWKKTRAFAATLNTPSNPFHFTYFISGVYFLTKENSKLYQGPGHLPGQSDIGFGNDNNDLLSRIDQINGALADGDEIGSHLNGHFDGSKWTPEEWEQEFSVFNQLLASVYQTNGLVAASGQPSKLNITSRSASTTTQPGHYSPRSRRRRTTRSGACCGSTALRPLQASIPNTCCCAAMSRTSAGTVSERLRSPRIRAMSRPA